MSWVFDHSPYEGKVQMVHLILADHANDDGLCWPNQATIAAKARCSTETVRTSVKRMVADGLVVIEAESNGRGHSHRYRVLTPNPSEITLVAEGPSDLGVSPSEPETPKSAGENPQIHGVKPPNLSPKNHQEPTTEPPSTLHLVAEPVAAGFDEFWSAYPRRAGKGAARKAWDKAIAKASVAAVIAGAERYRDDPNREDAFTAHPSTWLNQERWLDEPLPSRAGSRPSGTAMYLDVAGDLVGPPPAIGGDPWP